LEEEVPSLELDIAYGERGKEMEIESEGRGYVQHVPGPKSGADVVLHVLGYRGYG
jgi:hypothetical protein